MERTTDPAGPAGARRAAAAGPREAGAGVRPDANVRDVNVPPADADGNGVPDADATQRHEDQGPLDRDLVEQVLGGRREAFDDLIRRYQRQAVAVSYRLLGNSQDALEVTQDAFLKAFTSLSTLQKPEAFGGWLMRIVSNLSLNYRRSRKTRKSQLPLDDLLGPTEPSANEMAPAAATGWPRAATRSTGWRARKWASGSRRR